MLIAETWRPVPGYEGRYEASDLGRVRSLMRQKGFARRVPHVLCPKTDRKGRLRVLLYKDGGRREIQVHTIVLWTFIGPCPPKMESCHHDDNPKNCRLDNLRWDTRKANAADAIRNGVFLGDRLGEKHPLSKLWDEAIRVIRAEPDAPGVFNMLATAFDISPRQVRDVRAQKYWGHVPQHL